MSTILIETANGTFCKVVSCAMPFEASSRGLLRGRGPKRLRADTRRARKRHSACVVLEECAASEQLVERGTSKKVLFGKRTDAQRGILGSGAHSVRRAVMIAFKTVSNGHDMAFRVCSFSIKKL